MKNYSGLKLTDAQVDELAQRIVQATMRALRDLPSLPMGRSPKDRPITHDELALYMRWRSNGQIL